MSLNKKNNNIIHQPHTIDIKHSEIQDQLYQVETVAIPELINKKNSLIQQLSILPRSQVDEYMGLSDQIKEITVELRLLKLKKKI